MNKRTKFLALTAILTATISGVSIANTEKPLSPPENQTKQSAAEVITTSQDTHYGYSRGRSRF